MQDRDKEFLIRLVNLTNSYYPVLKTKDCRNCPFALDSRHCGLDRVALSEYMCPIQEVNDEEN